MKIRNGINSDAKITMLKLNFKIAWRYLMKDRQFSLLNLIGLSTGLACAVLIFIWVNDELQVDKFHKNKAALVNPAKSLRSE
jgi:putative ABC transport system permease protein